MRRSTQITLGYLIALGVLLVSFLGAVVCGLNTILGMN